ncbi:MAG: hypothetical protein LIP01_12095 [Tannerellaceae bacterium]|nr:hypothetical protein [Tannerellaceae bacterium]
MEIDNIYRKLVDTIHALYLLGDPDEQDLLEEIIKEMNVIIEREIAIIKRRTKNGTLS